MSKHTIVVALMDGKEMSRKTLEGRLKQVASNGHNFLVYTAWFEYVPAFCGPLTTLGDRPIEYIVFNEEEQVKS